MKEKFQVMLMLVVSLMVVVTIGIYLMSAGFDFGSMSTSLIVIVIAIFATYIAVTRAKSVRRGLPAQDELTKKTMHKAGYYTFLCTIYLALAIPWISEEIIGRHVSAIIIIGSALLFFVFYLWFSRKGDV